VKFELHLGIQPFESVNMTVSVSIPTILRSYTNDARSVSASGESLEQVIADLEIQFPGIADRLIEDGKLRRFVNIYINDEDVRFTGSLAAAVSDGDSITVLPAVAGG
jgi:molybdopterin converting factor small subunit